MNMKKKLKNFFTLKRRADEGFTLIELIITIAIVAILGGVAVPAYSGYIAKADAAADAQIIADINKAFAAACMVEGVDNYKANGATATITDKKITAVTAPGVDDAVFYATFDNFFDNEGAFKKTEELAYNPAIGGFAKGTRVNIGGFDIFISEDLAAALKDNTFSEIGADVLLGKVDTVSDIAALLIGLPDENGNLKMDATFNQLVFDEEGVYIANLMKTLGMENNPDEFWAYVTNEDGSYKTDIFANSLVLTAAQKTQGMDTSFLGTKGSAAALRKELDDPETATDAMAKLALTYGMYTSYVKNTPGMEDKSDAILANKTFTGMTNVLSEIESEDFQKYLASDQGKADMDAYMSSMQIVNNSANQSADATKDILTNGLNDPDIVAALNGLMK